MAIDKRATRLGVLALVGTLLFRLVGARLWFLQTVEQECAAGRRSITTKLRTVPLLPERGRIFDADGRIWPTTTGAHRRPSTGAIIRTRQRPRRDLPPPVRVDRRADRGDGSPLREPGLQPVPADAGRRGRRRARRRPPSRSESKTFPGCRSSRNRAGCIPFAPLASHVVGYMGRITAETKDHYTRPRLLPERTGRPVRHRAEHGGQTLHGTWGSVTYEVDNASRIVREVERVPPINGNDIQLTIDLDQQQFAEQALETQLALRRQATAQQPARPRDELRGACVPGVSRRGAVQGAGRLGGRRRTTRTATSSRWRAIRRSTIAGSRPTSATASSNRSSRP